MDQNKEKRGLVPRRTGRIRETAASLPDKKDGICLDNIDLGQEAVREAEARQERKGLLIGMVILSAVLLFFLTVIFLICMREESPSDQIFTDEPAFESGDADTPVYSKGGEGLSVAEIYEKCKGSVVSISAKKDGVSGVGSGFVYASDGYIATANHVIEGMDEIYVIFADGTKTLAKVIAGNSFADIALLKVGRSGLQAVEFGDSQKLAVRERVVAIGTPASLDYAGSVSSGEVSYLDRVVKMHGEDGMLEKKMKVIQTTAPLNPGNSGCPLFDTEGRVVGMVTMKLGSDFSGMGFALHSTGTFGILEAMRLGKEINESLLSSVCVKGARVGIVGETDSEGEYSGVRISSFSATHCDAALKLKVGDLVVSLEGEKVKNAAEMSKLIENYYSGDIVTVTVLRSGQLLSFEVVLTS